MDKGIKYFMYARKSSEAEDRQVASIEAQIDELNKIAKESNLHIIGKPLAESQSAKAPGRPVFNEMIQRLQKGEAHGIICWKLDRLARNPVDGGQISWMLQQGKIQHIQSYERSYYPTDNVLMMAVELGMANQFILDLSVNVKRGLRKKLEEGDPIGQVPQGYLNTPDLDKGTRTVRVDPERFSIVRKMWDLMLTGNYNPQQVLEVANNDWGFKTLRRRRSGGKPFSRSAIYRLFNNPFYYGMIEHRKFGKLYQGRHQPMVTKEEYDRVQILLGSKAMHPAAHNKEFAHTGQIRCGECKCQVTAEDKHQIICSECKYKFSHLNHRQCPQCEVKIEQMKSPTILHYTYYHCTKRKLIEGKKCSQGSIKVKDLEQSIVKFLSTITINQEFVQWGLKYLDQSKEQKGDARRSIIKVHKKELEEVIHRLDGLLEMRMAKEITEQEYSQKKQELEIEKQKRINAIQKFEEVEIKADQQTAKTLTFAERAMREYEKGDLKKKREIVATFSSNITLSNRIIDIEPELPFEILTEATKVITALQLTFEPNNHPMNKRKNTNFDADVVSWLGRQDSNL